MAIAAAGQLNLDGSPSWGSRGLDCFEKLEQIGEGTYGQVYMAKETKTGEIVALKMIKMDNEKQGFPITAIREIKILKKLRHQNIINLKETVTSPVDGNKYKGNIYLVFEYMDHDLTGLSNRPGIKFTIPQIKCYMRQLLTGLHYCHVNQVLHRDIKCSNLLIDNKGSLKLADFGLARFYSQNANLTNHVITLWYRPPELLLKSTKYGPKVDMWSVGCIFAELLHGKPILPGKNELDQLTKIYELCGTPDDVSMMPAGDNLKPPRKMKRRLREVFKYFDHFALDLLDKMLALNPKERISAKDALDAEYFWADPLPCHPKSLPKYESSHEFQTKKRQKLSHSQNPVHGGPNANPVHHGPNVPPVHHGPNAHPVRHGSNSHPVRHGPNAPLVHLGPNVPPVHHGPIAPPGYDRPNMHPVHSGPNAPPVHGGPNSGYNEPRGRPFLPGRGRFCNFG